jgi:hypothetical protein
VSAGGEYLKLLKRLCVSCTKVPFEDDGEMRRLDRRGGASPRRLLGYWNGGGGEMEKSSSGEILLPYSSESPKQMHIFCNSEITESKTKDICG